MRNAADVPIAERVVCAVERWCSSPRGLTSFPCPPSPCLPTVGDLKQVEGAFQISGGRADAFHCEREWIQRAKKHFLYSVILAEFNMLSEDGTFLAQPLVKICELRRTSPVAPHRAKAHLSKRTLKGHQTWIRCHLSAMKKLLSKSPRFLSFYRREK